MLNIYHARRFRKDYKLLRKRHQDIERLNHIIIQLVEEKPLEQKYKDHSLKGIYRGYRECHIGPDWLLIYKIEGKNLFLTRTGSHSGLFK